MSEVSLVKSKAMIMLYNNNDKAWEPAGSVKATSFVQVYHHEGNNSFRIVGRNMNDPQVVLINSAIARNLKYNAATATFHQWRDQGQVYGLNFHSKDDASQFKTAIDNALEELNATASPKSSQPQQYVPQTNKNWQNRYVSQASNETNNAEETTRTEARAQEPESPKTVSSSISMTPATPVAPQSIPQPPGAPPTGPAIPQAPAAPPAPPAPPAAGGVPAPPPPPPPPPSGGGGTNGGSGGGGLAAQIAAAKLKKAAEPKPEAAKPAGGAYGGDMMAEMQRKLKARKAKEEGGSEEPPPQRIVSHVENRQERAPSVNKIPSKVNHVPPPPSPAPSSTKLAGKQDSQRQNGPSPLSSNQLEEFKAEILSQFRKELDIAKAEIIQAMKQEISRLR